MLFWQQVIGYVQRFMPANYAQAFCEGLDNTNKKLQESTPQGRSLKFEKYHAGRWVPTDFYPLFGSRLGFDFAMYGGGAMRGWLLGLRSAGPAGGWRLVSELMSIKNSSLTEPLTQQQDCRRETSKLNCVVM
jgi:hypothetical protein